MDNVPTLLTVHSLQRMLRVHGHIWQGDETDYEYTLKPGVNPTTLAEAKQVAGDFESLSTAEIIVTESVTVISERKHPLQ